MEARGIQLQPVNAKMRDAQVKRACLFEQQCCQKTLFMVLFKGIKIGIKHKHMYPRPAAEPPLIETETYAADHSSKSFGCVRMAALVKFLRMSGSWGGMLICWAQ